MPEEGTWKLISSCAKLGALLLGVGGGGGGKPSGQEAGWVEQDGSVAWRPRGASCPALSSSSVKDKSMNVGGLEKKGAVGGGGGRSGTRDIWDPLLQAGLASRL